MEDNSTGQNLKVLKRSDLRSIPALTFFPFGSDPFNRTMNQLGYLRYNSCQIIPYIWSVKVLPNTRSLAGTKGFKAFDLLILTFCACKIRSAKSLSNLHIGSIFKNIATYAELVKGSGLEAKLSKILER